MSCVGGEAKKQKKARRNILEQFCCVFTFDGSYQRGNSIGPQSPVPLAFAGVKVVSRLHKKFPEATCCSIYNLILAFVGGNPSWKKQVMTLT